MAKKTRRTHPRARRQGMKMKTLNISPSGQNTPSLSTPNKPSFLDLPRELRDLIYSFTNDSIHEPEIEKRFQWAHHALIRGLPCLGLLMCCRQAKQEYAEEFALHPPETSLVIEIGNGDQREHKHPWHHFFWDSVTFTAFRNRMKRVQTLQLIFHLEGLSYFERPFYEIREALPAVMDLSNRLKTRFIYTLDMPTLREHLETFGNILPAAMMRDAFYRCEPDMNRLRYGQMDDDGVETRMRQRRGEYENETVTIVHDRLFEMRFREEVEWEEHPKNRIGYKVTLEEPEKVRVLRSEAGYAEGVNDVVPKNLKAVRLEVMPILTGSFEEVEKSMMTK